MSQFSSCLGGKGETESGKESQREHLAAMFFPFLFQMIIVQPKTPEDTEKLIELSPKQHINFFTNLNSSSGEYLASSKKTDICYLAIDLHTQKRFVRCKALIPT